MGTKEQADVRTVARQSGAKSAIDYELFEHLHHQRRAMRAAARDDKHGIDPQRYRTQLLTNLAVTPISQIERWLPDQRRRNPMPSVKKSGRAPKIAYNRHGSRRSLAQLPASAHLSLILTRWKVGEHVAHQKIRA